ncbi:MAG TPA: S1 RNA-binding domain-containing protein [Gemmataceae bacterium]|nr:S1 RNA-binding domain-containing protein [Gemmataceae bacterium]
MRPPREKPQRYAVGGSQQPKSLEHEQTYGFGKHIDAFDDEMEKQLQEAMGGLSDKELYGEPEGQGRRAKPDDGPKKGKVFRIHGPDVFIDLPGGRTQGVLPLLQFPDGPPEVGTEVDVHIEGFDHANGVLLLSRKGAAVQANWDSVAVGMIVEARVTEVNKGGLAVDVNGIRGFMPISQIDLYRVEDAAQFVNQRLRCLVTEVDPAERNLVVSRRALLEKEREENRDKLWHELQEGQIREGIVRSVKDFGAFVDLGGVDGLIHVSDLSWVRVQDVGSVVQLGQKVKVVVLKLDREHRKVGLGLKQLTASPWDDITARYHIGQVVTGKATRLMDFGAFVELEPAVEGLIHISELAPQRVRRVIDVVRPGQEVQVMVLSVDPEQRRISLSLKQALPQEPAEPETPAATEEPEVEAAPPRPRSSPLRGGIGQKEY